jgi:hypothetical protein
LASAVRPTGKVARFSIEEETSEGKATDRVKRVRKETRRLVAAKDIIVMKTWISRVEILGCRGGQVKLSMQQISFLRGAKTHLCIIISWNNPLKLHSYVIQSLLI